MRIDAHTYSKGLAAPASLPSLSKEKGRHDRIILELPPAMPGQARRFLVDRGASYHVIGMSSLSKEEQGAPDPGGQFLL